MRREEVYDSWRRSRADGALTADFVDSVMKNLPSQLPVGMDSPPRYFSWLIETQLVRFGICTLAIGACAVRVLNLASLFFVGTPITE